MNDTVPTNSGPDPVADHAEDIIKYLLGFDFPAGAFDHLRPEPHQLSAEAISLRIVAMKGRSFNDTAAVVTEILTELELYRLGYDVGNDAGWDARLNPATMDLAELRGILPVLIEALDRMISEAGK